MGLSLCNLTDRPFLVHYRLIDWIEFYTVSEYFSHVTAVVPFRGKQEKNPKGMQSVDEESLDIIGNNYLKKNSCFWLIEKYVS